MSNRHLARTIAMQTLYQWDFNQSSSKEAKNFLDHNNSFESNIMARIIHGSQTKYLESLDIKVKDILNITKIHYKENNLTINT